jgi:hypothetical protein
VSGDLVITPWKRYGHDRVYVARADGTKLGYLDRKTELLVLEDESCRPEVERALGLAPAVSIEPYAVTIQRFADDLGRNRPGSGARQMAREKRDAAPVRSLLARVVGGHTDERAWRVGAEGERLVGGELDKLAKQGWVVVHDVPVGDRGANIDHVVVGPGGVFTVNSKYHWDKRVLASGDCVYVNGHPSKYIPVARHEAERAARLLGAAAGAPVVVTAVLSIVSQHRVVKNQPRKGGVLVMGPRETRRLLEGLPPVLAPEQVSRLGLLARRSTTWRPGAS